MSLALFLGAGPVAHARHIPEPFTFELELQTDKLIDYIQIQDKIWLRWFGEEARVIADLDEAGREALRARVQRLLVEQGEISIDRVPVTPVIEFIEFQEGFEKNDFLDYVAITAHYPVKGRPRQVSIRWLRYDEDDNWSLPRVIAPFRIYEDDIKILELTETEPQYIWHAPTEVKRPPKPYVPPPPPMITVPVVTAGLIGLLLVVGLGCYFFVVPRLAAWTVIGIITVASIGFAPVVHREYEIPWGQGVPRPDPDEAQLIFEALHRNIYRAFDYDTESEVYDALARSVDGSLIESVYQEVYQSLIMREAEGAVCDVRAVDVDRTKIEFPDDDESAFRAECEWRVTGEVAHWGHKHWRKNGYRARYDVHHTEEGWRITAVSVESQERLPLGESQPSF